MLKKALTLKGGSIHSESINAYSQCESDDSDSESNFFDDLKQIQGMMTPHDLSQFIEKKEQEMDAAREALTCDEQSSGESSGELLTDDSSCSEETMASHLSLRDDNADGTPSIVLSKRTEARRRRSKSRSRRNEQRTIHQSEDVQVSDKIIDPDTQNGACDVSDFSQLVLGDQGEMQVERISVHSRSI